MNHVDTLSRNPDAWSLLMAGAVGGFVLTIIVAVVLLIWNTRDDDDGQGKP